MSKLMGFLDCEQPLFCSKIRRETRKKELETTSACQRNMRSREPYVARASEDERKETPTLLAARGFSTRCSYVTHAVTPIFPTDFRAKERLLAVYPANRGHSHIGRVISYQPKLILRP